METTRKKITGIVKEFRNPIFEVYIKTSRILGVKAEQDMEYDKEQVEQIISNVQFLAQGQKYLVLISAGPLTTITFQGLRALASHQSFAYAHAKAYVIHTLSQRIMANFYLRYFKPKVPVKFFKNEREAELWLLKSFRHIFSVQPAELVY